MEILIIFRYLHHPRCLVLGVLEILSLACIEFLTSLLAFHLELWWKHCLNKCFENCHPRLPSVVVSGVTEFILHKSVPFLDLECQCKCRGSCRSHPLFTWCSNARSLFLVLGAAHCGEGLNRSTYTALKQNRRHWVFSLFLETENFFHMLGIVSDPKPDVDSFQQHQSHLEEVSKPLWNCLGWLWCILVLPAILPWVLGNFWELVEHKAGRHCHCVVKREKQRTAFVGTRIPPWCPSSGEAWSPDIWRGAHSFSMAMLRCLSLLPGSSTSVWRQKVVVLCGCIWERSQIQLLGTGQ